MSACLPLIEGLMMWREHRVIGMTCRWQNQYYTLPYSATSRWVLVEFSLSLVNNTHLHCGKEPVRGVCGRCL